VPCPLLESALHESNVGSFVLSSRRALPIDGLERRILIVSVATRKRTLDLVIGLPLALLSVPLLLVLTVGSLVAYRAWPLFAHERVGRDGRIFRLVKVRSLPRSTPRYLSKHDLARYQNNEWGTSIRRHHLDELPQLWHVVSGHMSLVGPRPEMPQLVGEMPSDFVRQRLTMLPGCTGLWQITAASSGMIRDAQEFDLYYVKNATLRLDLWILIKTVGNLLRHSQLESLNSIPKWTRPKAVRSQVLVERSRT
jgi:lipopolysaccharide/colanic/teichoic acid biosynthesis glycosyltransferase